MPALSRQIFSTCTLILCMVLAIATTACNSDKAADAHVKFDADKSNKSGDLADDMPTPPADAQYTIVCRVFSEDQYHVQDSRLARQQLARTSSLPNKWYVVHAGDHSTLYYGFYRSMDPRDPVDGTEGQRALDDLNAIRSMQSSQGVRFFPASLLVTVDAPDPSTNPAWDITRSPGVWSIEIATATSSDRKIRTVDAVREARKEGIEAYYYHGETASSVCIGSWPAEAAIEHEAGTDNKDPEAKLLATIEPLSPAETAELEKNHIKSVAPTVDVIDPTLMEALRKWKEHSVNGVTMMRPAIDTVTHQQTTVAEHSFLFKIPHRESTDTIVDTNVPPPTPAVQNTDPQPGVGHLRSLGN